MSLHSGLYGISLNGILILWIITFQTDTGWFQFLIIINATVTIFIHISQHITLTISSEYTSSRGSATLHFEKKWDPVRGSELIWNPDCLTLSSVLSACPEQRLSEKPIKFKTRSENPGEWKCKHSWHKQPSVEFMFHGERKFRNQHYLVLMRALFQWHYLNKHQFSLATYFINSWVNWGMYLPIASKTRVPMLGHLGIFEILAELLIKFKPLKIHFNDK